MATLNGAVHTVDTLMSRSVSEVQLARVKFTVAGTYVQADNAQLVGVPTLIQNSRRNGKTVTMVGVMKGTHATKESSPTSIMSLKTVAISSADVTFELTDGDESTELAAGAVPGQARPFEILVGFTEA